ncbi:MAG: mechanosensitive ion channel [Candidatus Igneacidithiobacillus chanchocoensis]
MLRRLLCTCVFLLLALLTSPALAAGGEQFANDAALLRSIHHGLTQPVGAGQLRQWQQEVQGIVQDAAVCTKTQEASLANLNKSLAIVGPPVADEPSSLTELRQQLSAEKTAAGGKLAACKVLYVGGSTVLGDIRDKQTQLHTRKLLQRGPNLWQQIVQLSQLHKSAWKEERNFWIRPDGTAIFSNPEFQGAMAIGIALYIIAAIVRRQSQFALRELFPLAALLVWGLASYLLSVFYPLTLLIMAMGAAFLLSDWLSRSMLRHLNTIPARAQREAVLLRVFWRPLRFVITFMTLVLVYQYLDPQGSDLINHHTALVTLIHTAILSSVLWVLWRARRFTFLKDTRWLQFLLFGTSVALILLNFFGFMALADYLTNGFVLSLVAILVARVITWFIDDIWGNEEDGEGDLPRLLRRHLGLSQEGSSWLSWLRLLSQLLLWSTVLIIILLAWGLSRSGFAIFWQYFIHGFDIGTFHIQPFRWLIAIALLFFLFNVNQWLQKRLSGASGIFRHFDIGSRHSILAIFRYVGFIVAILLSLSTAGVALHNLAIIAGALSVGIGFGLQNIVNNFVSGIILLLERPIRVGDWVKVGTTEGYVQRLSIRSTLILTFDRTEVFVPNSELISGQVTNWTYSNSILRLMIPLRVHHHADIDEVREILEEVGKQHPEVLQDDPRSIPPTALLLDVTENALVFYLRVYIADCNNSFMIQTELRAQAVEALHRRGIRLAHQQQDIHFAERTPALDGPSKA